MINKKLLSHPPKGRCDHTGSLKLENNMRFALKQLIKNGQ